MQLWNSFNLNRLTNPRDCNCAGDNVVGCRGSASNREERSLSRDLTKLVLLFLCSSLFDPAGAHFDPVGALFDSGLLIYLISLLFDFLLLLLLFLLSLGFILCCLGAKVESVFYLLLFNFEYVTFRKIPPRVTNFCLEVLYNFE